MYRTAALQARFCSIFRVFPKNGILRKTTVVLHQDFSAAQTKPSCCLQGEGAQSDEDWTLPPSEKEKIVSPFPSL